MLVVCAILILLAGLITPTFSGIREMVRRAKCQTNLSAFAKICAVYAVSTADAPDRADRMALPKGRIDDPTDPESQDNYLLMNTVVYQELVEDFALRPDAAACRSLMMVPDEKRDWLYTQSGLGTYLGLIYWCGRKDIIDEEAGEDIFLSRQWADVHKREDIDTGMWEIYTPTTEIVATCWMVLASEGDSEGPPLGAPEDQSWMPHIGSRSLQYAAGTPWEDMKRPDGIAASYLNGSARWVGFSDRDNDTQDDKRRLLPLLQLHTLWYTPD
jgi:hypothetical protein